MIVCNSSIFFFMVKKLELESPTTNQHRWTTLHDKFINYYNMKHTVYRGTFGVEADLPDPVVVVTGAGPTHALRRCITVPGSNPYPSPHTGLWPSLIHQSLVTMTFSPICPYYKHNTTLIWSAEFHLSYLIHACWMIQLKMNIFFQSELSLIM